MVVEMMRRLIYPCAALALLGLPIPTAQGQSNAQSRSSQSVQSTSPELARIEVARRYVVAGRFVTEFVDVISFSLQQDIEQRRGAPLEPEQVKRLDGVLREVLVTPTSQITDELAVSFAEIYTVQDLSAAASFFESEAGQRYKVALVATLAPVLLSMSNRGASTEAMPPPTVDLDVARLTVARRCAEQLRARYSGLGAGVSTDWFLDVLARGLASRLNAEDLAAAEGWLTSAAGRRMEQSTRARDRALGRAGRAMKSQLTNPDSRLLAAIKEILFPASPPT